MTRSVVLVVDDDQFFRSFCADTLRRANLDVLTATGEEDILEICAREPVALVLVDVFMPKKTGIELLEEIKAVFPSIDVVVSTGYASVETAVQALKKGASDYLRKPFSAEELSAAVGNVLARRKLYQDNEELKKQLRLYELSRSFAAVEEPLRVATLGLDALREITGARGGLYVGEKEDGLGFLVAASRNLSPAEETSFSEAVQTWLALPHLSCHAKLVSAADPSPLTEFPAPESSLVLLVPLTSDEGQKGVFMLLKEAEAETFTDREMNGADFLGGQISIAYKAAERFQEAKGMAYIDSLTDLYNSRYLPVILEKRISEANDSGKPLSLIFLDLDNFKDVNTAHGHLAGSKTLIELAWILEANVRSVDTVVRYGGDEFTIVLPNTDTDSAREISERIRKAIMTHSFLGRENLCIRLTACIGVATFPVDAKTPELLINMADKAMYRGKETTKNVVHTAFSVKSGNFSK